MRSFYSPRQKTTCILLPWDIRRKLPVIVLNQSPNAYFDVSFFFKQGYEAVPFARGNLKSALVFHSNAVISLVRDESKLAACGYGECSGPALLDFFSNFSLVCLPHTT